MHTLKTPRSLASQRGAATLLVTLMLFFALAIAAFGLNRHLIVEQRISANQARAAQAFEAAEAGLDWAQAQLNGVARVGADCRPTADPLDTTAAPMRDRALVLDRISHRFTPTALQPVCVRSATGWSCGCGSALPEAPRDDAPAPAFAVHFIAGDAPGSVRVAVDGCSRLASPCAPGSAADATARNQASLALFPALRHPPAAALTTRDAGSQSADQFFAASFGTSKQSWRDQAVVARIACSADCGSALAAALRAGHAQVWVDGDLNLAGPLTLGSSQQPVAIVVRGKVRLDGAVTLVGALYAASISVSGGDVQLQGAVLSEDDASSAASAAHRDADVLAALAQRTGSFVRIAGSWHDF